MTPKQTCINECENGFRSCMEGCRSLLSGDNLMDNRGTRQPKYDITDANCSSRCNSIFSNCKKSCDSTVPTSYDKSGKKQN